MARSEYLKPYWLGPVGTGAKSGAVVVHGFTGVPWDVLPVGEGLASDGFTVDLPLLAGHDGGVEGIKNVTLEDWRACVDESAARVYKATKKPLLMVGFSMGGLLALDFALRTDLPIAGVASLAAPLKLGRLAREASKLAATKDWAEPLTWPKFNGSDIEKDVSMPGADGIPLRAVSELDRLIQDVRRDLPALKVPLLVVQSRHDHTSPSDSPWELTHLAGSRFKRLVILKRGFHVITRDVCWAQVVSEVRAFAETHAKPPKKKRVRRARAAKE
jgi:carboxylesterase